MGIGGQENRRYFKCIVQGRNKPKLFDGDIPWVTTPDLKGKTMYQILK
jgi:hypothetical protein